MSNTAPDILQTQAYITPTAFAGLYDKGLVIAPNQGHIARMGEIIGNELPDYALPAEVSELAVIVRGRTNDDDSRRPRERDIEWLRAGPDQPYLPASELQVPTPNSAQAITKDGIVQAGRYVLEFSAVNSGTWGHDRPERFARQWAVAPWNGMHSPTFVSASLP